MGSSSDPQPQPEKAPRPWLPWAIGTSLLLAGVAVGWIGPALLLRPLAGAPPAEQPQRPVAPVDRADGPAEPAVATAKPGQLAELTWVMKNTGNTTWSPDKYWFSPVDGAGSITVLPLPAGGVPPYIEPNELVIVTARITAPDPPGPWQVSWQLLGPDGPVPGGLIKGIITVAP